MPLTSPIRYRPKRPFAIAKIVETYAVERDRKESSRQQLERLIHKTLKTKLQDSRVYVFPGFCNFNPGLDFLRTMGLAAGYGGALISVAPKTTVHIHDQGRFKRVGGRAAAFHSDWAQEVATVIERLADDLMILKKQKKLPHQLIVLGHSKGGMLVYALAIMQKMWASSKRLPKEFHRLFPGVNRISHHRLALFKKMLATAVLVPVATPLHGLHSKILTFAKQSGFDFLTGHASHGYSPDYIDRIKSNLGKEFAPEKILSHAVFAAMPAQHAKDFRLCLDQVGLWDRFVLFLLKEGAHLLFDTLGRIQAIAGYDDGLVCLTDKPLFDNELIIPANHISIVEEPRHAVSILEFIP